MASVTSPGAVPGSTNEPVGMADPLELAAQSVDNALVKDRAFQDLANLLQVPSYNQTSITGWNDRDYPSFADQKMSLATQGQIGHLHRAPLPSELLEQFAHIQCNCMMGIFPDIERTWLTVDSDIFVWNYHDGSDLAYFDGLSETILSVGLIKPKARVFQPHIEWLLCLATPVDIILLGVSFVSNRAGSKREMHLLPDPLFCLSTDGVQISQIVGTQSGRIFMAGRDGCLYEFTYKAADGWFTRQCQKINHTTSRLAFMIPSFFNAAFSEDDSLVQIVVDESRHYLYSRSEKGTIQVYHLGSDGNSFRRVAAMSSHTIMQTATAIAKTIDKSNFSTVITIAPVTLAESEYIHLVAITSTGMRLYFGTSRFDTGSGAGARVNPYLLVMVHVRLPPGFSMNSSHRRPNSVHSAYYRDGTLVMASKEADDKDLVWIVSSDAFPFHEVLRETADVIPIEGCIWALGETSYEEGHHVSTVAQGLEPPSVVKQHVMQQRRYVLVNSLGTCVVTKHLPVGQLRQLLEREGPESPQTAAFFEVLGEQACACSVQLACSQRAVDTKISEMAAVAFFKHGGTTDVQVNSPLNNLHGQSFMASSHIQSPASVFRPAQVSTPVQNNIAQQLNFTALDTSIMGPNSQGTNIASSVQVTFSPRYSGLCLYLARLVRSLWDARLTAKSPSPKELLYSTIGAVEVTETLDKLKELTAFMRKYSQFISPLLAESYEASVQLKAALYHGQEFGDDNLRKKYQTEADSEESSSLRRIEQLLIRTCECLGLWRILCDHQLHVIGQHLSSEQQSVVQMQTLRSLVANGREVCGQLISTLINLYIDDNAATDAVSDRLREICPSLYSQEDAICSKANEKLLTCHTVVNEQERDKQLREAISLYKQVSVRLNLPLVTNDFKSARCFNGIVDLALTAAQNKDPQGLGLHFYKNGQPADDMHGQAAYNERMECYQCILDSVEYLLGISETHPQAPSIPRTPGPPPPSDPNRLSGADAEKYAEEMFTLALKSDDELFHVALYDWLVTNNMPEKMLEIHSPYLEVYLKKRCVSQPDQLPVIDLLWKYYEKNKNFSAAAKILSKLADLTVIPLGLAARMEYLSRAIMCAKSSTTTGPGGTAGEFLHQLEEKMDVARLQMHILDSLSSAMDVPMSAKTDALQRLNSQLLDITTLYREFSQPFDMPECSLAILHCSGHQDPTLVQALWQDIITKELQSSQGEGKMVAMNCIKYKLVSLGKVYANSERYFPLAFLIKCLEIKSCEHQFFEVTTSFVLDLLEEIGVPKPRLLDFYDRLLKSKDACWAQLHQPLHLLKVIYQLLLAFTEKPATVPSYERPRFTLISQDLVSGYLVELQSGSLLTAGSVGEEARLLVNNFKSLQAQLDRLLE